MAQRATGRTVPYLAIAVLVVDYVLAWQRCDSWLRLGAAFVVAGVVRMVCGRRGWPEGWWLSYGDVRRSLRWTAKICVWFMAIALVLAAVGVVLIRARGWRFPVEPQNVTYLAGFWPYVWRAVLLAPLIEELIYRGLVHPPLRGWLGRWGAVAVGGMAFWVLHWVYYGAVTFPNHLFAGCLFGLVYDRTRSLLAPTLLHALGNLLLGVCDLLWLSYQAWFESLLGWH